MNIAKKITAFALLAGLCLGNAGAATLSLEPGAITVAPGAIFSVDLVISGLGNEEAPSLGDFDIDIGFDPFALSLVGYEVGPELGDIAIGEAIDVSFGELVAGVVNVAEVSFLTDGELDTLQLDSFVLVSVDFMVAGLAAGASTGIDIISVLSLGDAVGNPIGVDGVAGTSVTAIPLPAAVWLFAGALSTLGFARSRSLS